MAIRELDRRERETPMGDCQECYAEVPRRDLIDGLCEECDDIKRPRCDWCGEPATSVVDLYVDGLHIERIAVCSEVCARGSDDHRHPVLIDTVVDAADLQRVIASGPCWCDMRKTTVLQWCPRHGTKKE